MLEGALRAVGDVLGRAFGQPVVVTNPAPLADGWSAAHSEYPHLRRCEVSAPGGLAVRSVIVKSRRTDDPRGTDALVREHTALALLAELGTGLGPRVLAHADDFLVLEDLGRGPSVEDLLVGSDRFAARDALVALAVATGRLHAATIGQRAVFADRLAQRGVDATADRIRVLGLPLPASWTHLRELMAGSATPITRAADRDFSALVDRLTRPGAPLALSNGDLAPQNNRLIDGAVRLLDFERAGFHHIVLDAAQLGFPFCAAPCWARIPPAITAAMASAYRAELAAAGPAIPGVRDYQIDMAAAMAACAVTRMLRLPKLRAGDDPHPNGFSRRGQLLDTIQVAIDQIDRSMMFIGLRNWLVAVRRALRTAWPGLPASQPIYAALRSPTARRSP